MATIREKTPGRWQVQIRRKGWPHQTDTFGSKRDAEIWGRTVESQMDRAVFVDQGPAQRTTLAAHIEDYIQSVTRNRPSENSAISEEQRLRRFLKAEVTLCAHSLAHLKPEHFEDFRDRRLKQRLKSSGKTLAPGTVKRELTTLKRVLDHKRRQLGLIINPLNSEDVKRPVVIDERDVRLTPDQRSRLMKECYAARNDWLGPMVELGFGTGARRGNLLRLRWSDVDLQNSTALLRGIKNSRNPDKIINHQIGLTPRAVEVLLTLSRHDERIFPITGNCFRLAFNRARKRANVEHFRFHDTRHERTSSLFEAGWSMVQVMAQTGHRDPKSVKRYANFNGNYLAEQLAKLR